MIKATIDMRDREHSHADVEINGSGLDILKESLAFILSVRKSITDLQPSAGPIFREYITTMVNDPEFWDKGGLTIQETKEGVLS